MSEINCDCWDKPYKPNSNPNDDTDFLNDDVNKKIRDDIQELVDKLQDKYNLPIKVDVINTDGVSKPNTKIETIFDKDGDPNKMYVQITISMPDDSYFASSGLFSYSLSHEMGHIEHSVREYDPIFGIQWESQLNTYNQNPDLWNNSTPNDRRELVNNYLSNDSTGQAMSNALMEFINIANRNPTHEYTAETFAHEYLDKKGIPRDSENGQRFVSEVNVEWGKWQQNNPTHPSHPNNNPSFPENFPVNPTTDPTTDPNNPDPKDPKDPLKCGCAASCKCGCQEEFVPGPSIPPWWFDNPNYNRPWQNAINASSPLVLDLNGGGITTTSLENGVWFDHDGNGFSGKSGWLGEGEGLLVLDINGNNGIDDGGELFGNHTLLADGKYALNGFNALAQYDTNGDKIIDENDAIYHQLKVWVDKNGDGVADEGELLTLAEAGVKSINTGLYQ